jgi:HEAT repeat protein
VIRTALLLCLGLCAARAGAQPAGGAPSPEAQRHRAETVAALNKVFATEKTNAAKVAACAKALATASMNELQNDIVGLSAKFPCKELDAFLGDVLTNHGDAVLRGKAARLMGRVGSEACLEHLVSAAARDKVTIGVIGGDQLQMTTARGPAILALADLAERFPLEKKAVIAVFDKLELPKDEKTAEPVADARAMALHRLTGARELFAPIVERLKHRDARVRVRAAHAFAPGRLAEAPMELLAALGDGSAEVRGAAAYALGTGRDPRAVGPLLERATDEREDFGVRSQAVAALGQLKAERAKEALRKLAEDDRSPLAPGAALSYYQITGEKLSTFNEPKK